MDAKTYLREVKRMCGTYFNAELLVKLKQMYGAQYSYHVCEDCPMAQKQKEWEESGGIKGKTCFIYQMHDPMTAEDVVRKWSRENPKMTRWEKWSEVFGEPMETRDEPGPGHKVFVGMPSEWWYEEYTKPK